jgi:DnaJ-class molecular chaperone
MQNRIDYYKILGVSNNSTKNEIRAAFVEKIKKIHPDKKYPFKFPKIQRIVEKIQMKWLF